MKLVNIVIPVYLTVLKDDEEKAVVTETCICFQDIIQQVGPAVLQGNAATELATCLQALLTKQAVCQSEEAQEEGNEEGATLDEEEEAEIDALLIDSVADTIAAMAVVMQGGFSPFFHVFFPLISKYYVRI
jgi:hypothetical protein